MFAILCADDHIVYKTNVEYQMNQSPKSEEEDDPYPMPKSSRGSGHTKDRMSPFN